MMRKPEDLPDPLEELMDRLAKVGLMSPVEVRIHNDAPVVLVRGHRRVKALRCLSDPDRGEPQPES